MNVGKTIALLAVLATIWGATYMHDGAHRYDIVAAGAGSGGGGGSKEEVGNTGNAQIVAYLLDHKTGKLWYVNGPIELPAARRSCEDMGWTVIDSGCRMNK